jgi:hypothetical protein
LFNIYSANDKKDDVGQEIHFSLGDGDAVLMPSARWGFFLSSLSLTPHTLTTLCPHVSNMNVLKRTHTYHSSFCGSWQAANNEIRFICIHSE